MGKCMTSAPMKPKRPVGVTLIAIVAAAGGLLSLFGGGMVLSGMASGPILLAYIVIIFGILGLLLGYGFFKGPSWAWTLGIVIYLVSIALGIAEIVYGGNVGFLGGIIRVIAGVIIPVYLTRNPPRQFFGKARTHGNSGQNQS